MINSGISKENLIKLGLGGFISINSQTQFTDDNIIKHKDLKEYKLDLINKGTLRNPEIDLIVKETIDNQSDYSIYKYYSIPINPEEKYSSECNIDIPLFGQLSYYNFDKKFKNVNENDFFKKFINKNKIIGTNITGSFSRFSFDSAFSNHSTLSGLSYNLRSGTYVNSTGKNLFFTTQTAIKDYSKVRLWTGSNTSGVVSGNFKDYYIPYPNTVDLANYNAYSVPLKISTFLNDLNENSQDINGILVISTGNGTTYKICYISPHGLKSGYQNTYTYGSGNSINQFNNTLVSQRISSGILLKSLTLGSEYYTGKIFPETGVRFATEERSGDWDKSSVTGITGHVNNYDIDANQYFKQDVAIKDTLFYKFYSGLYTGSKTFNTGTWNGIIPTGMNTSIEFVSTELNKEIGMGPNLYFIYSGFGTNDFTDVKCFNYLSHFNEEGGLIKNTKIQIDGSYLKIRGYGFANTPDGAFIQAKINAKYNFLNKISKIIKTWTPEFIYQNRKYRSLRKFLRR
jgi:hypothetical protein